MKKIMLISLVLVTLLISKQNFAQIKFYTSGGTKEITEIKCGDFTDITVKVPVPTGINGYDDFTVNVLLSSLDVSASCEFNKTKITSKLVGKSEVSLLLISADGKTSDFFFTDAGLDNDDLCTNPRLWNMEKVTASVKAKGWVILSYNTESYWDDYKGAWVSKQVPVWDAGEVTSEGTLTITQKPLSDGIFDRANKISIKAPNTEASYWTKDPADGGSTYEGGIGVNDNSLGEFLSVRILYFNESKYTTEFLKEDLMKTFSTMGKPTMNWKYFDFFSFDTDFDYVLPLGLKKGSKEWETVTIDSKEFSHYVYTQKKHMTGNYGGTKPAMKLHFYVYYSKPYTIITCGNITSEMLAKGDDIVAKAETIISTVAGSLKVSQ